MAGIEKFEVLHLETLATLAGARTDGANELSVSRLVARGEMAAALDLVDSELATIRHVPDSGEEEGVAHRYLLNDNGRDLLGKLLSAANSLLKSE